MRLPVLLLLPFAMAACGSPGGNAGAEANKAAGNAAAAPAPANPGAGTPAAPAVASAARLQAGQWELTALVRSIEAPGAPAGQEAALRRRIGRPMVNRTCMSEAQARDFASFANREQLGRGCSVADRVYADGIVRMRVSCPVPGGRPGTIRMAIQGRYTPTSLDLEMSQEVPGPGGALMRMSANLSGRRIGACPADGAAPRIRMPSNSVPVVVPTPPPAPR